MNPTFKMKEEISSYNALVKSIKPFEQRKDAKGKDTFNRAALVALR